jgi:hypothetical protein
MISISYNYSSNDIEFLEQCIEQAKIVTDDIHFTHVDKFFNGDEENKFLIDQSKKIAKNINFHELKFQDFSKQMPDKKIRFKYWHNACRLNNTYNSKYKYVLYLDGDEILDGIELKKWLNNGFEKFNCYVFNVYWYFRSKNYQAKTFEEGPIMVNKNLLTNEDIMNISERWALLKNPCARSINSLDNKPMIHHFSWAKGNSDEECKRKLLSKVESWGHSTDRDWKSQIEEEFSRPFNGTDFVHNYNYNILI